MTAESDIGTQAEWGLEYSSKLLLKDSAESGVYLTNSATR